LYQILGVTIGKIHNLAAHYTPSSPTLNRPELDAIPNKEITIFDFDDCVYGWYRYAIFDILVVYQGADKGELASNFLMNLLSGYPREKLTSIFWINQMLYFLKLLEIEDYMLVYKDYDASENLSWIGKFLRERKKRIENDIPMSNLILRRSFVQSKFIRKLAQIPHASHLYNQQ
jgi:hypothetical protein